MRRASGQSCLNQSGSGLLARRSVFIMTAVGFAAMLAAPAWSQQKSLDDLAKAAKREGEVFLYSAATENVSKKVGAAFEAKYGIKVNFLRLVSGTLKQRYASEAEAGTLVADVVLIAGGAKSLVDPAIET